MAYKCKTIIAPAQFRSQPQNHGSHICTNAKQPAPSKLVLRIFYNLPSTFVYEFHRLQLWE